MKNSKRVSELLTELKSEMSTESELKIVEDCERRLKEEVIEDLPGEIWKNIEGYDGRYQVSNMGRIKSFCKSKVKILRLRVGNRNYFEVILYMGKSSKNIKVHSIVAKNFIPNPENKPMVNHKDGNKLNNRVDNLEWSTYSENQLHAFQIGLIKTKKGTESNCAKLSKEIVIYIREHYKCRDKEFGGKALSKKFGVSENTIKNVVDRKRYANIK